MDNDLKMAQESQSGPSRSNSNSNSMEDTSERPGGHDRRHMQLRAHTSTAPQDQTEQHQTGQDSGHTTPASSKKRSGGYGCNKCGEKPKEGHVCPFQTKIHYVVEAETQTYFPDDDENDDNDCGNFDGRAVPNNVKSSSPVAPK